MASGYQYLGTDLDLVCEPRRSGVSSANFGGAAGRYKTGTEDMNDRYASYPSGYGYAQYPTVDNTTVPSNIYLGNGNPINPPSAGGRRPHVVSGRIAMQTAGTWYIWRESSGVKVRNPSGTITNYPSSLFGTNIPPIIMICRAVGGGGGGGGGNGSVPGNGGSGAGSCAAWVTIPDATESTYATLAMQCTVGGAGGGGGKGGSGGGGAASTVVSGGVTLLNAGAGRGGPQGKSGVGDTAAGTASVSSPAGSFFTASGGDGGAGWNGRTGYGASSPAYSISPDATVAAASYSGGGSPGRGGGGGASAFGTGGNGGANGTSPTTGSGYGVGGGGATWILFSGQNGAAGRIGQILFDY